MQFDESGKLIISEDTPIHVLSYDEKPEIQTIATISDDLMPDEKHPTINRYYEYKHLGTLSLLAAIDLQTGEAKEPEAYWTNDVLDHRSFFQNNQLRFQIVLESGNIQIKNKDKLFMKLDFC